MGQKMGQMAGVSRVTEGYELFCAKGDIAQNLKQRAGKTMRGYFLGSDQ